MYIDKTTLFCQIIIIIIIIYDDIEKVMELDKMLLLSHIRKHLKYILFKKINTTGELRFLFV